MKKSIRLKVFLAIALIAVIFLGIIVALNGLFYEKYYLYQRKNALENLYRNVLTEYAGEIDAVRDTLNRFENKYGMRVRIISGYYIIYDTNDSKNNIYNFASGTEYQSQLSSGLNYVFNQDEYNKKGYSYMTVKDAVFNNEYLCIVCKLSDGSMMMAQISVAMMQDNVSFANMFIIILSLIAFAVCLLLSLFASKKFTKPIIELSDIATSMATLDFSKKYSGKIDDEIGQLGENINLLSYQLEKSITELRNTNQALKQEIKEKERIDNIRREFIINASHELKTPISLIGGYAEGLLVNINDSEEDKNYYCNTIIGEANRLNDIVMQLLNLSKLELGNSVPQKTIFDAFEVVEDICKKLKPLTFENKISLYYSEVMGKIFFDYEMFGHVVTNLLTNAIRHTEKGGKIKVYTKKMQDEVKFVVYNEGENIADEELSKIWEKFYKVDKAHSRNDSGSGIGLSIVSAIVNANGGRYGVRNLSEGVEFYILIPDKKSEN